MTLIAKIKKAIRLHGSEVNEVRKIKNNLYEITTTKPNQSSVNCQYRLIDWRHLDSDTALVNGRHCSDKWVDSIYKYLCFIKKREVTFVNMSKLRELPTLIDIDDENYLFVNVNLAETGKTIHLNGNSKITPTKEGLYARLSDCKFIPITHISKTERRFFNITAYSGKINLTKFERIHKHDKDNPLYNELLKWKKENGNEL